MKLIREQSQNVEYIVEGQENPKHYISGIFMQAGVPNRNKRIYPLPILENEVNRFYKDNIKKDRAYCELGHPDGPNVNLDRVAAYIKDLHKEGNDFHGKALIASTPMGNIVKGLLNDGANLGVSSRALGTLKPINEGLNEVQSDLRLIAIDIVADPSAPEAYVQGIMENVEYWYDQDNDLIIQKHKEEIKKTPSKHLKEQKFRLFEEFLDKLSKKHQ